MTNRLAHLVCRFGLLACALELFAAESSVPPEFADARKLIEQGVSEGRVPSVAVAVVKDDRLLWAEGFGFADLESQRPATADSIYLLASVSKPITATGLMVLVDRGQVDLDKPANGYLPGSKLRANLGSADEITVRRLANHTSGMQVHYNFYYDSVPPLSHDEVIRRYGIAHTEPGLRIEYCNLAFGILDYITEAVSGMPWRGFMEQNVYDPIGMSHTSDRVRPGLESMATRPYQLDLAGKFIRVPPYQFDHNGASAIWSSARDLSRFLRLHLNSGTVDGRRLLKEETARSMRKVTARRSPARPEAGFGVAWALGSTLGHVFFEHTGGMPGVATWIRGFPEDRAGFVVLINASGVDLLGKVADQITRALFPDGREVPRKTAAEELVERKPEPFVGEWKGALAHWEGDIPMVLRVAGDGNVTVRLAKREPIPVREVAFANRTLKGQMRGLLKTQEGYHGPVTLEFNLNRAGEELIGIGVAKAEGYFALSHGVRLSRQASEETPGTKE
ncbi:MAG: beta-lactamase family protein [Verrucomicrobia bacterium]|nr:beta-lactamase family protein [Verrucomicrobiota bacterium]